MGHHHRECHFLVHLLCACFFAPEWAGFSTLCSIYPFIFLLQFVCQELGVNPRQGGEDGFAIAMLAIPFIGALLGGCLGFIASFVPIPPKWKSGRCFLFIKNGMSSFKNYFFFLGKSSLGLELVSFYYF